jgi:hypothetical protein
LQCFIATVVGVGQLRYISFFLPSSGRTPASVALALIKKMKPYLIILTFGLLFSSFNIVYLNGADRHSTVILKMNYKSPGFRGFGGSLTLRNTETNEVYKSESKIGFKQFIVLENIPIGEYEVQELEIISGGPLIFIRDKSLFNELTIDSAKNYYLGNYLTQKIKPILKLHIAVTKIDSDSEDKIIKNLPEEFSNVDIEYSKTLFKEERTEIEINN